MGLKRWWITLRSTFHQVRLLILRLRRILRTLTESQKRFSNMRTRIEMATFHLMNFLVPSTMNSRAPFNIVSGLIDNVALQCSFNCLSI